MKKTKTILLIILALIITSGTFAYATLNISAVEAYNIVKNNDYTSLQDVMDRVNVSIDLVEMYQHYVDKGVITFE